MHFVLWCVLYVLKLHSSCKNPTWNFGFRIFIRLIFMHFLFFHRNSTSGISRINYHIFEPAWVSLLYEFYHKLSSNAYLLYVYCVLYATESSLSLFKPWHWFLLCIFTTACKFPCHYWPKSSESNLNDLYGVWKFPKYRLIPTDHNILIQTDIDQYKKEHKFQHQLFRNAKTISSEIRI